PRGRSRASRSTAPSLPPGRRTGAARRSTSSPAPSKGDRRQVAFAHRACRFRRAGPAVATVRAPMVDLAGRVALITGAGRGRGREYAHFLAAQGARIVVNDCGVDNDGTGGDHGPADDVVAEIVANGGEAVASYHDVASW